MGNRGTKNWKLTAFFAIALMLMAGLFSNAAFAQAGAGTAGVQDGVHDADEVLASFLLGQRTTR